MPAGQVHGGPALLRDLGARRNGENLLHAVVLQRGDIEVDGLMAASRNRAGSSADTVTVVALIARVPNSRVTWTGLPRWMVAVAVPREVRAARPGPLSIAAFTSTSRISSTGMAALPRIPLKTRRTP